MYRPSSCQFVELRVDEHSYWQFESVGFTALAHAPSLGGTYGGSVPAGTCVTTVPAPSPWSYVCGGWRVG